MIAGIGGIALIVFLFFDWIERHQRLGSLEGGINGFIVALAGVTAVKFAGLAAMGKRLNIGSPGAASRSCSATLATLLIIYRWHLRAARGRGSTSACSWASRLPPRSAIGALLALREGGWEPLVNVVPARRAAPHRARRAPEPRRRSPLRRRPPRRSGPPSGPRGSDSGGIAVTPARAGRRVGAPGGRGRRGGGRAADRLAVPRLVRDHGRGSRSTRSPRRSTRQPARSSRTPREAHGLGGVRAHRPPLHPRRGGGTGSRLSSRTWDDDNPPIPGPMLVTALGAAAIAAIRLSHRQPTRSRLRARDRRLHRLDRGGRRHVRQRDRPARPAAGIGSA